MSKYFSHLAYANFMSPQQTPLVVWSMVNTVDTAPGLLESRPDPILESFRRGEGLEMAHFQIVHTGVTLAVCSRLRPDGFIEIEIGLGDPKQAARVIPAAQLRRAEARVRARYGQPARRP